MGICLLRNGSMGLAAGRQEDNECPRVAPGCEFPGKERRLHKAGSHGAL